MTFFPSKSTIFVPNNLIKEPKICVDCGTNNAGYYSYGYQIYVCMECSKIHDVYLGKYNLETQLRYKMNSDQLVDNDVCKEDGNLSFNKEFELFLPEFYQKMGVNTPQVIRKEYIISKYSHKAFTSSFGLDKLLPPSKIGILWKKGKSKGTTWHPCCVKVDKNSRTFEYFSHKSNRLHPKATIPLKDINLFVEPMFRSSEPLTNDGEFYLHIIWTKNAPNKFNKVSFLKKKSFVNCVKANEPETQVRNFYFRPSTDIDLFQWYFSILAGKHEIVSPAPARHHNTLKRSYTSDMSLDNIGKRELFSPMIPCKSLFDLTSDNNDLLSPNREFDLYEPALDPLLCSTDALMSSPVAREIQTLPDRLGMMLTGSYCMDTGGDDYYSCCVTSDDDSNLIGHDDEVEGDFKTNVSDFELSGKFYSCHPEDTTNPFLELEPLAQSVDILFQEKSDICPIFDPVGVKTDKTSWICSPVNFPTSQINSCPLHLSGTEVDHATLTPLYDTLRLEIKGNKKRYQISGWLYKVGEMSGDIWRARWFTLSNTLVTYSESNLSPFPKNHFYLGSGKGFNVDTNYPRFNLVPPPTRYVFRILTPMRVFHVCAQSEEIRRNWIEIISRVIALSFVFT